MIETKVAEWFSKKKSILFRKALRRSKNVEQHL